jgi:hypothetical protein
LELGRNKKSYLKLGGETQITEYILFTSVSLSGIISIYYQPSIIIPAPEHFCFPMNDDPYYYCTAITMSTNSWMIQETRLSLLSLGGIIGGLIGMLYNISYWIMMFLRRTYSRLINRMILSTNSEIVPQSNPSQNNIVMEQPFLQMEQMKIASPANETRTIDNPEFSDKV